MAFLDIVLGILLAYGLIRGMWNGLFAELASILSLFVGLYIAIRFSLLTREVFQQFVSWNPQSVRIAAFILTFILVLIGITILAKFCTTVANFAGLGLFNKLLGGIAGMLKMALIISVVLNLFAKLNSGEAIADKDSVETSILYEPVRKIAAAIFPSLKIWFSDFIENPASTP